MLKRGVRGEQWGRTMFEKRLDWHARKSLFKVRTDNQRSPFLREHQASREKRFPSLEVNREQDSVLA